MQVQSALFFESPEEMCLRVFRQLKPRTPLPAVELRFCKYAAANSYARLTEGKLELRISDALQAAPAPILEALLWILLAKLFRKPVPRLYRQRYKIYLNRKDVQRTLDVIRRVRGRKRIEGPEGSCFNLDEIFDRLNQRFFGGLMPKPRLGWSLRASRSMLGHYDYAHHAIVLSRFLDSPEVPPLVVEYILYHEMLHLKHPMKSGGARRRIHTPEFREEEKRFPELEQAKRLLRQLCTGPWLESERRKRTTAG